MGRVTAGIPFNWSIKIINGDDFPAYSVTAVLTDLQNISFYPGELREKWIGNLSPHSSVYVSWWLIPQESGDITGIGSSISNLGAKFTPTSSPPVASFTYSPENPIETTEITFNASSSSGNIVKYEWDFGDGTTAEGSIVTHVYLASGKYTVSLKITDKDQVSSSKLDTVNILVPVILVHGWHGSPETWSTLKGKLDSDKIPYFIFDYSPGWSSPISYAITLRSRIKQLRVETGYMGKFDIICHSMGAMVSRWYIEELGGSSDIRQWIGIAPVNNGAAIADFFFIIPEIIGGFFPELNGTEEAIQHMNIRSTTLAKLNYDLEKFNINIWGNPQHISPNIKYRIIMGINYDGGIPSNIHSFSPVTAGKTLVAKKNSNDNLYIFWSRQGDGVVRMEQSKLKGTNVGNEVFEALNHNTITHDLNIIQRVINYLKDPSLPLVENCPANDPDDDHEIPGLAIRNIIKGGSYLTEFVVDNSVEKLKALITWPGSDLKITLISPSGKVMQGGFYPVVEYWKGSNSIWYGIDLPEPGKWVLILSQLISRLKENRSPLPRSTQVRLRLILQLLKIDTYIILGIARQLWQNCRKVMN